MPLPSYAQIRKELAECRRMCIQLSIDPHYKITARPAIEFEMRKVHAEAGWVVFLDIDDCHGANRRYGYEEVNKKIRHAIHVRHADVLLRARWFSGDELLVILRGDPEGFMNRLRVSLKNVGLSAAMTAVRYTGNLESDVAAAIAIVQAQKEGYLA